MGWGKDKGEGGVLMSYRVSDLLDTIKKEKILRENQGNNIMSIP